MANEIDLNDLTIKTDSLPDDWKMMLIDPAAGVPAKNMTVARFIELLIDKSKIWTQNNDDAIFANRPSILESELDTFASLKSGAIQVRLAGSQALMLNFNLKYGSTSGMQFYGTYTGDVLRYRTCIDNNRYSSWKNIMIADSASANALTNTIISSPVLESRQVRGNLPANTSISNYSDQSAQSVQDGSIPVKSEPQEQYVWSIDKIGRAVLELQEENKRLKQILNISDDSEVQQM